MTEVRRVPGPSSPLEGRSGKIVAVIALAILIAIAKPWGGPTPGPAARAVVPSPSASAATGSSVPGIANYDPYVFGLYEPNPAWELWPAGFLVSFGFATRIEGMTAGAAGPSASPDGSPSAGPGSPPPAATPPPTVADAADPVWPARITISSGSHLSLVGVNTPLEYDLAQATLARRDPSGGLTSVPLIRPPSPWPVHFTILAIDDGNGRDPKVSWPPGMYVLDLRFVPGAIEREVEIVIEGTASGGATSTPEASAAVAAP